MGKIQILDDHLANQIAAGEVVERPASIVKELVENAIDARATRVQVMIEEGGISFIKVSDNGIGMDREDAVLAFSRHATSKIKRKRDLFAIRTLGFRGEALPSIASVAKVELITAHDPSALATKVTIQGKEPVSIGETSRSRGTDVIVRNLFYNTPARLKYLKTVNTEVSHVADILGRLAFAHPDISFSLTHNGRQLFYTTGDGKLLHVLLAIYGKQVAGHAIPVQASNVDFHLRGLVTKPEVTRSNRSYLSIILNGRYVRSLPITQSVLRTYGTLLPKGRYPIGVLHLKMDARLMDVNVHPSKLEVRLSKEKECRQFVENAIRQALQKERLVPAAITDGFRSGPQVAEQQSFDWDHSEKPVLEYTQSKTGSASQVRENVSPSANRTLKSQPAEKRNADGANFEPQPVAAEKNNEEAVSDTCPEPAGEKDQLAGMGTDTSHDESPGPRLPAMTPLAQVHGTYIVAQTEDGFYLLDQHAAHERIYYEVYARKLGEDHHQQYPLLVPLTIECTPAEAEVLHMRLAYLQKWGLDMEPFGGTTFVVRAYPTWFPKEDESRLIHEIIDFMKENGKVDTAQLRDATAKMMACKAAIKANRNLRRDEMEELLKQLNRCQNPFTCPHGRPIFVHFSVYDLEKMFKRVM
ncbi:DNA mismatch repair endonuclease MutL [Thermoactinomyces mirandus]|uniref:DNA mismatch repair protein MutL n=1 Tax=Thermoactinomyces mirandus TaxID=2756294 RepID=A0A7W1XSA0_9BACL|nr:DNA mismatch repair endonuclease MutL [Thermoactinomyces mirandus]MBA4602353.1 DNA mismatch repair endonuclease MutL [Thermoactinomyces mirandus]